MANYTENGYDPSLHGYWRGTIDGASNYGYPRNYYYADTIRSVFIAFTEFFNDVHVIRYNEKWEPVKTIQVPIKYGPRQKSHDFRVENESDEKYYISLPNFVYKLENISFDANRASGIYEQRAFYNDELSNAGFTEDMMEQYWSDVQPVPYNINVQLILNCEKMTDLNQVLEQILAKFKPAAFMNLKEFWWFNKRRSIKVKLDTEGVQIDNDAMGEEDRRIITATFSFTVECMLYNPIHSANIIEKINTYLTTEKSNLLWHDCVFGNKNGSLDYKYDFSKIYNTGVMHAWILKEGFPKTTYYKDTSAYVTNYEYETTEDLATYDSTTRFIKSSSAIWCSSAHPILVFGDLYVDGDDATSTAPRIEKHTVQHPATSGDHLVYWDSNINMYHWDGKSMVTSALPGEWFTSAEYYYPGSGFKKLNDPTVTFGNKTLFNNYDEPYTAHYSEYNEEGTYSETSADYVSGKVDYQYSAWDGAVIFSGGKYQ